MSDRIAVINAGELMQIDPPLTCYNEPANLFVAGFIGSPSMNFVRGEVTSDGFLSDNDEVEVAFEAADVGVSVGDRVTLGVRPEDVYPEGNADDLAHPTKTIDVMTDVLEPMGNEIFVYLLTEEDAEVDMEEPEASGQLLMSVSPDSDVTEDQPLDVVLDRSRLHLFDTETEEAIAHGLVDVSPGAAAGGEAEAEGDD